MALPARIDRHVTAPRTRVRSPAHRAWVRGHMCCVPGCTTMPIEAAHVRSGTDGGMGMKPGDDWVVSLCHDHHAEQHRIGETSFEHLHGLNLKALAREFASRSPHKKKLEVCHG